MLPCGHQVDTPLNRWIDTSSEENTQLTGDLQKCKPIVRRRFFGIFLRRFSRSRTPETQTCVPYLVQYTGTPPIYVPQTGMRLVERWISLSRNYSLRVRSVGITPPELPALIFAVVTHTSQQPQQVKTGTNKPRGAAGSTLP